MKHFLSFLVAVLAIATLKAQLSGEIIFEEKIDMHRRIPADRPEMKDMLPPYRTQKWTLAYTESQSIFTLVPGNDEIEINADSEGGSRRMTFRRPPEVYFHHFDEERTVVQREFFSRKFLIKDVQPTYSWKLTGKQKEILGHSCQEAVFQDTARTVVAWFAPALAVPGGPHEFGQLPGMILQVDVNGGERLLTAVSLTEKAAQELKITEPKEGKSMTRAEYQAMVREKMAEMNMQGGPGGGFRFLSQP